jgi:hypothetical protein
MIEHFKQESTWRGLIALVIAAGVQIAPELQEAIISVGLSLIGLINIIKKD